MYSKLEILILEFLFKSRSLFDKNSTKFIVSFERSTQLVLTQLEQTNFKNKTKIIKIPKNKIIKI